MLRKTHRVTSLLVGVLLCAIGGCAGTPPETVSDPFERVNRTILKFNLSSDRLLLRPTAKVYQRVVPAPARSGIRNFFANLWEPMNVANSLLQGEFKQAARSTGRFVINSTFGLFGLFDFASGMRIERHTEDFGETLAVWGVRSGPYLVLPFFGPSTVRDTAGLIPKHAYADALQYTDNPERLYGSGLRLVDVRERLLGSDTILEQQPDPYLFLRETYLQLRANQIFDGEVPSATAGDDDDALIDELLSE